MNYIFTTIIIIMWLIIISLIVIVKRKQILSFFFPQNWVNVIMLESDNNVNDWLQKKNKDLRFTFNDGYYNMFESADSIVPAPSGRMVKGATSVYRSGRLATFLYVEGNENPVDLRNLKVTGNPQLNKQLTKVDIGKLFVDDSTPFINVLKQLQPYLIIGGVILLVIIVLRGN